MISRILASVKSAMVLPQVGLDVDVAISTLPSIVAAHQEHCPVQNGKDDCSLLLSSFSGGPTSTAMIKSAPMPSRYPRKMLASLRRPAGNPHSTALKTVGIAMWTGCLGQRSVIEHTGLPVTRSTACTGKEWEGGRRSDILKGSRLAEKKEKDLLTENQTAGGTNFQSGCRTGPGIFPSPLFRNMAIVPFRHVRENFDPILR